MQLASIRYPFSQLIREIFLKLQGLRARLYVGHTPSEHNAVDLENFLTPGGLVLADFFVASPSRRISYNSVVAPRNQAQNLILQLRKEGI